MDKKKELLLKILTKLQWHWPLAEGFLVLLESEYVTEEIIDKLILALQESLNELKSEKEKSKIEKSLELIQKIKSEELKEDNITDDDLDKLLDTI